LALWLFGSLALWLFGSLALWLFGSLALWLFGSLALWIFGSLALWLFGSLALWLFGSLALWLFGSRSGRLGSVYGEDEVELKEGGRSPTMPMDKRRSKNRLVMDRTKRNYPPEELGSPCTIHIISII
jgi:hypothetical protein